MRTSEKRQRRATKPQSKKTLKRVRLIGRGDATDQPIDDSTDRDDAGVEVLVNDFNDGWRLSLDGVFKAGGALAQLQEHLKHKRGAYERVLQKRLNITTRTAERLIKIAKHPVLRATHVSHPERLPRSWGTLHEMTRLPENRLQRALEGGEINANTERKKVEAIYEECRDSGILNLDGVPEAFGKLNAFREEYPDGKDFASRVHSFFDETKHPITFEKVGAVLEWAAAMNAEFDFIHSEQERMVEEGRERRKRERAEREEEQRLYLESASTDDDAEEAVQ
jgi:hypothetical protein